MRILSSDLLIADMIVQAADNPALAALIHRYDLKPGGKTAINKVQFDEFSAAVAGQPTTLAPGGSSANVLVTFSKLLPNDAQVDFIGVAGEGPFGAMIRGSLEKARIALHPDPRTFALPKPAVSYVVMLPGGERTIATYPGNARELLTPAMITDALVKSADAILLQGSLWMKFGADYADRMLALAERYGKEIWLALPTYSMAASQHVDTFKHAITRAHLVLGNEEELARIYGAPFEQAVLELQRAMTGRMAFITRGEKGAALINRQTIQLIAPILPKKPVVSTLGAGDTAFAGFLAGYIKGKKPETCAEIAMQLAAEKLTINGPRLLDCSTVI